MYIKLNIKEKQLKDALMILPPDFFAIEHLLKLEAYTVESISKVGTDYVWDCVKPSLRQFELGGYRNENQYERYPENLGSD